MPPAARWLALGLSLSATSARGELVINEFLPDPQGADAGREFVEILNTGPWTVDLLGVALQFANGSESANWVTRWTGQEPTLLPSGERFLLVDRNWLGEVPGHVEVWLGLQNGPDAIRLTRGEVVLDLVGYGPLTDEQLMELNPVPVTPGLALARRPDGRDTGDNAADFISREPTPGSPNFLPFDLRLSSLDLDPPAADRPQTRVTVTVTVTNAGTEGLPTGPLFLEGFSTPVQALMDECPPEATRQLTWLGTAGPAGRWPMRLIRLLTDPPDTLSIPLGFFQVGPADLVINEVLSAPDAGQGEWVELGSLSSQELNLGSFRIKDEDGNWLALPDHLLPAGGLAVVAQDPAGLHSWSEANLSAGLGAECLADGFLPQILEMPGGWPNLNNAPSGDRDFADRVYLGDASGTVLDLVTLGEGASGSSWERIAPSPVNPTAENWAPCTSLAGGTPGCPNSVSLPGGSPVSLDILPAVLDPVGGRPAQHFRFRVQEPAVGWWLRVFSTWGEAVRDMGGDMQGDGPRDLVWDGRDDQGRLVSQGVYVVLLQLRGSGGEILASQKGLTVVRR